MFEFFNGKFSYRRELIFILLDGLVSGEKTQKGSDTEESYYKQTIEEVNRRVFGVLLVEGVDFCTKMLRNVWEMGKFWDFDRNSVEFLGRLR